MQIETKPPSWLLKPPTDIINKNCPRLRDSRHVDQRWTDTGFLHPRTSFWVTIVCKEVLASGLCQSCLFSEENWILPIRPWSLLREEAGLIEEICCLSYRYSSRCSLRRSFSQMPNHNHIFFPEVDQLERDTWNRHSVRGRKKNLMHFKSVESRHLLFMLYGNGVNSDRWRKTADVGEVTE